MSKVNTQCSHDIMEAIIITVCSGITVWNCLLPLLVVVVVVVVVVVIVVVVVVIVVVVAVVVVIVVVVVVVVIVVVVVVIVAVVVVVVVVIVIVVVVDVDAIQSLAVCDISVCLAMQGFCGHPHSLSQGEPVLHLG